MSNEIESTHDVFFSIDVPQHGVPSGANKVVTSTFWNVEGGYGNVPLEGVVAIQALGVKFLDDMQKLGAQYDLVKKERKAPKGP